MFGKKSSSSGFAISSLIGPGTVIEGNVSFTGGLRIEGTVKGNVFADGDNATVVLCELATVEGEVKAPNIIVNGTITGSVYSRALELQPKARILGDVQYGALEMHPGAVVQGYLSPVGQEVVTDAAATVSPKALSTPGLKLAADSGAIPNSGAIPLAGK
jgi:cytoskeletal protein CcmA (bactofilin family)